MRILLTTYGTAGDVPPFVALGRELQARGHEAVLVTHGHYEQLSRAAGLGFAAFDRREEFDGYLRDLKLLDAARDVPRFFSRQILPRLEPELAALRAHCVPGATIVVARSTPGMAARILAETTGAPLVSVFITPSHIATTPLQEELLRTALGPAVNEARARHGLAPVADWRAWMRLPRRHIGLWPDWLAAPEPGWPPDVQPVGFLLDDGAEGGEVPLEAERMLAHSTPAPLLITGGTGYMEREFYAAAAQACALLGRRAMLVVRHAELVPDPLPPGVAWFPYLPFSTVMARVGAVIHHGGGGTLARASLAGVPQLIMPLGSDRPGNADRAQRAGLARWLLPGQLQPALVARALEQLLDDQELRERCRERGQEARWLNAAAHAAQIVEDAAADQPAPALPQATPPEARDKQAPARAEPAHPLAERLQGLSPERRALILARLKR